jgi:hypothetical protein
MNEELVEQMPQCFEEGPKPRESKEQGEQRRRLDLLKRWEIYIHVLDRGCFVRVGCKSIAFTSIEAGYKEIGRYLENPQLVATQHGFEEHV